MSQMNLNCQKALGMKKKKAITQLKTILAKRTNRASIRDSLISKMMKVKNISVENKELL